ncbi:hypothetical protein EUV02_03320 [Polymorphobacter arshaanensis]|uniref:Uncharacterized protein n=1 Tax=Glacieibacterium arshaanense TaxID=2511025 RepID=A0A4Y9ES86_9SPHN|nr:hypothetical protein [Polymorphobacter arshaanensis]TFU06059.1 hypothetical protein EUV02_03320 [Polymorphobacter arshaanensis]
MRSELRLAVGAAALLLVAAAPDTAVTLPFAPPNGVPIRYDCTALRTLGGRPLTITSAHELQFAGAADKRSVRWTVKSLAVSGDEPVRQMLQATGDIAVGQPVDIALTADGATAAITNEAALRAHVRAATPAVKATFVPVFAPAPEATRTALQTLLDDELAALDPQTPEEFAASWLEVVEPLLGGEAPLVPDAVVKADVEAQAPIGGGALRYKLRYGLRDYVPGKSAQVFHDLTADPEDVQRYAAEMVAQMFPDAAPGQNEATATRAILSQMTSGTQITSDISLPTGLRTRFSTATTTELPGRPKRIESRECRLVSTKVL